MSPPDAFDMGIPSSPCNQVTTPFVIQICHQVSLIIAILDKDIMTFDKDIKVWKSTLDEFGIDRNAMQELFLLAQANYDEANSIVGKLLKKRNDNNEPRNASAFVHRCVVNARNTMYDHNWSR